MKIVGEGKKQKRREETEEGKGGKGNGETPHHFHPVSHVLGAQGNNIQIVTGIEVNSESYFPQLWEYCPSTEGTRAIFPQLREIRLTIDR